MGYHCTLRNASRNRFVTAISVVAIAVQHAPGADVTRKAGTPDASSGAEQGLKLAESGRCPEALPLLTKSVSRVSDRDLKRSAAFAGVRCAMALNQVDPALEFIR